MRCAKCGHQFFEGIFCPECGTRYVEPVITNPINKVYEEPKPTEINQKEIETIKQTKENNKAIVANLNVRGTMYDSLEKAEKAKMDHNKVDILKNKLSDTVSQKKRREIIQNFPNDLTTTDAVCRFEKLKEKSERRFPISILLYLALNLLNIVAFVLFFILTYFPSQESFLYTIGMLFALGWLFGILVWLPWTIVTICQLCSKKFFLRINHI